MKEVKNFEALASSWWNREGVYHALHTMNELRIPLIRDRLALYPTDCSTSNSNVATPLTGLRILDVGCGGGILAEVIH